MRTARLALFGALVWLVGLWMLLSAAPGDRAAALAERPAPEPAERPPPAAAAGPAAAPRPATIAFFVQASGSNCALVPRLLDALYRPEHVYVVHFDASIAPHECAEARRAAAERGAAEVPSVRVTYRGVSMVLSTVDAMALALRLPRPWDYFVNLSGADYPLVRPEHMAAILGELPAPTSFVPAAPIPEPFRRRYRAIAVDPAPAGVDGELHFMRANYPYEPAFQVFKGSAWMAVTRGFAEFVVRSDTARRMLLFFAHTVSSPEHYFCTLIKNSDFVREHSRRSLHRVLWTRDHKTPCTDHNQHPCTLGAQDWDRITKTGTFFARKVALGSPLLDRIDRELLPPAGSPQQRAHLELAWDHVLGRSKYTWPYA